VAYEDAMIYSFWPWRILTLFSPDFFGSPAQGNYWGYASYWEDHIYAGLLPLLLVVATFWLLIKARFGLRPKAIPTRWALLVFCWLLVIVTFILALGRNSPVFPFLYNHVPTFSMFQAPARYLVWLAFAIPILAAVGIEHWRCPIGKGLYWFRLGTAGAFAITLGAGLAWVFMCNIQLTFIRATALTGLWALGFGLLTLMLPYAQKQGRLCLWQWAVIGWTLADLLFTGWGLNPGTQAGFYSGKSTAAGRIPAGAGERVYLSQREEYDLKFRRFLRFQDFSALEDWGGLRNALIPNLNLLDGIASANNFDPLVPDAYARWMDAIETMHPNTQKAWLAYMNVGAVEHIDVSQTGGVRFDHIPAAYRLRWYSCMRSAANGEKAWREIQKEFDAPPRPERAVILEDISISGNTRCDSGNMAVVGLVFERPDQMVLEVEAFDSGWLVLSDTWYPGWVATVDGKSAPLYRADSIFRAVPVGSGKHEITLKYRPAGFYSGGILSILVLLFVLYLLTSWGRKSF
jgi:hypothetical protein